jgi:hypothetical protein
MGHSYEASKKLALKTILILGVVTVLEVAFALLAKGHIIEGVHFPTIMYGMQSIYKIPLFNPAPALPPAFILLSALILHIGHCACKLEVGALVKAKTKLSIKYLITLFIIRNKV